MAENETVYYRLDDGGAVVRLAGEWDKQVWLPSKKAWVDIEVNLATDAREIPAEEALKETGGFGEFAPDPEAADAPGEAEE